MSLLDPKVLGIEPKAVESAPAVERSVEERLFKQNHVNSGGKESD